MKKWFSFFWPIRREEHRIFLPLALINFCVLFNYTVLRNLKDALLITAEESGAEVLGFVKTWFILPFSLLLTFFLGSLSLRLARAHFFVLILLPFLIFFFLFGQWVFPHLSFLCPTLDWIRSLKASYPHFQWLFPILGHWPLVLFYILAELFGSASVCYGFWLLANASTHSEQAKRFYPFFGIIGNLALFGAGFLTRTTSQLIRSVPESVVSYQTLIVTFLGLIAIFLSYFLFFQGNPRKEEPSSSLKDGKEERSFLQVFHSPYLKFLMVFVFAYGCCINLAEVTWKHQIHLLYPDFVDYNRYMGRYTQRLGLLALFLPFLSSFCFRRLGWFSVAVTTPFVLTVTGLVFLGANLFPSFAHWGAYCLGWSHLEFLVFLGTCSTTFSKGCKYAFFDPSKEMVYFPLSEDLKRKGKALVDLAGTRFGKGISSLYQQFFLIWQATNQGGVIRPVSVLFALVMFFWWGSVFRLGRLMKRHEESLRQRESEGI